MSGTGRAGEAPANLAKPRATARPSWFRLIKLWLKRVLGFLAGGSTLLVAGWIVWQIADAVFARGAINLHDIGTTKDLADAGVTERTAVARLRDEIWAIYAESQSSAEKTSVGVQREAADITIPGAGISVASIASSIRKLLPKNRQNEVTGEFTLLDDRLSLRLRLNDRVIFSEYVSSIDGVDQLFRRGALVLLREVNPYVIAAWSYQNREVVKAEYLCDEIIAAESVNNSHVLWAYNLKGLILADDGRDREAKEYYKKASNLPAASLNLGILAEKGGNRTEAEQHYRNAVALNPQFESARIALAQILRFRKDFDEALFHFEAAAKINPRNSLVEDAIGEIYRERKDYRSASEHFALSVKLQPDSHWVYYKMARMHLHMAALEAVEDSKLKHLRTSCQALGRAIKLIPWNANYVEMAITLNELIRRSNPEGCVVD
jgi:tetratricopeptide (TPR) repeat protein